MQRNQHGFTLIELSIVLVIIGLIIGGVLLGQTLISAAGVRAQISQIEKYNSAVNTFHSKFNALPGDMNIATAQQFGFNTGAACTGSSGKRDGNGLIDGYFGSSVPLTEGTGETELFWQDLSNASGGSLIDGTFPNGGAAAISCNVIGSYLVTTPGTLFIGDYLPIAKIGHDNYVYVYEYNGYNWYAVSQITSVGAGGLVLSNTSITAIQAFNIDNKVDDGLPLSGNILAAYLNNSNVAVQTAPSTATSGGTSSSCYDTTTSTYSVTVNGGNGGNCALSFKFQ